MANGRCESDPMSCDMAAGSRPSVATSMVIMMGRKPEGGTFSGRFAHRHPAGAQLVDVLDHDHADFDRDADQGEEAEAGRHAEVRSGEQQAERIRPSGESATTARISADPLPRTEGGIQNERPSAAG